MDPGDDLGSLPCVSTNNSELGALDGESPCSVILKEVRPNGRRVDVIKEEKC